MFLSRECVEKRCEMINRRVARFPPPPPATALFMTLPSGFKAKTAATSEACGKKGNEDESEKVGVPDWHTRTIVCPSL